MISASCHVHILQQTRIINNPHLFCGFIHAIITFLKLFHLLSSVANYNMQSHSLIVIVWLFLCWWCS